MTGGKDQKHPVKFPLNLPLKFIIRLIIIIINYKSILTSDKQLSIACVYIHMNVCVCVCVNICFIILPRLPFRIIRLQGRRERAIYATLSS